MDFYIVIPAHNEEKFLKQTLDSLVNQSLLPKQLVIVNDDSTDDTPNIINAFVKQYDWITSISISSSKEHIPGSKVVNAFYKGLETFDENYDIVCKFDADLIFPNNYLESISKLFKSDNTIGIAGGLSYIKQKGNWVFEKVASKNHVRGPLKAYRKACFEKIGGIKSSIGWDTLDVLMAEYHGWKIETEKSLHVKHLKPTGKSYTEKSKYLQGEALYKMRFGLVLSLLSALKSAYNRKQIIYFFNTMSGFFKAEKNRIPFMVTKEEGRFIRNLRYRNMIKKFF